MAFAAWSGDAALETLREELARKEWLNTAEGVHKTRVFLQDISNIAHGSKMSGFGLPQWRKEFRNPQKTRILRLFERLKEAADQQRLLPYQEEASHVPLFSPRDGRTVLVLRELLGSKSTSPFQGVLFDAVQGTIKDGVPWITPADFVRVREQIREEKTEVVNALEAKDKGLAREAGLDYQKFEEFFRMLGQSPEITGYRGLNCLPNRFPEETNYVLGSLDPNTGVIVSSGTPLSIRRPHSSSRSV